MFNLNEDHHTMKALRFKLDLKSFFFSWWERVSNKNKQSARESRGKTASKLKQGCCCMCAPMIVIVMWLASPISATKLKQGVGIWHLPYTLDKDQVKVIVSESAHLD
jgi:hypothetical protein